VAVTRWQGRRLAGVTLHPITLGFRQPRLVSGHPQQAPPDLGKKIIDDLVRLSAPYYTTIVWDGAAGRITPATVQHEPGAPTEPGTPPHSREPHPIREGTSWRLRL
jgi:hypothetical protein